MQNIALAFLSMILGLIGIGDYPSSPSSDWTVTSPWSATPTGYTSTLASSAVIDQCKAHADWSLVFPRVVHSAQVLVADGKVVRQFGDPSFEKASPFYSQLTVPCYEIAAAARVEWTATSYSKFFSRFGAWPQVKKSPASSLFFSDTINSVAGVSLILLSVFSFFVLIGRVSDRLARSVVGGGLLMSGYFFCVSNIGLDINLSMLMAHKIGDICLWVGLCFFFDAFTKEGLVHRKVFGTFTVTVGLAILIILFGKSGDQVQSGTTLPIFPLIICLGNGIYCLVQKALRKGFDQDHFAKIASLSLLFLFTTNDVLSILGLTNSYMLLSLGVVGAIFGLSLSVNQEIAKTLENKVSDRTAQLSTTLNQLQSAQAELVQSARLASLGTLSAGIAHEINNSINYIHGALIPLERKVIPLLPEADRPHVQKLVNAMKTGTNLTIEIVKSLRNYTGLNQSNVKEVNVFEVVDSVTNLIRSKLKDVHLEIAIPKDLQIVASTVGLNQIVMNLVSNAVDALSRDEKNIKITAEKLGPNFVLSVSDSGSGMSQQVIDRIYDPFYTTKAVGQGTGLGMHIVKKEVDRHHGQIRIDSTVGVGTTFHISLPLQSLKSLEQEEAA